MCLIARPARSAEPHAFQGLRAEITAADIRYHIDYLTSPALEGRMPGTRGEELATEHAATAFAAFGLQPEGDAGTYFQSFPVISTPSLGAQNQFVITNGGGAEQGAFLVDRDWRPISFSNVGVVESAPVVFAGYGIVSPEGDGIPAYDAYAQLDVRGAWVLIFRGIPENLDETARQHFQRFASLRYKAMLARDLGAIGVLFVSGPNARDAEPLVPLMADATAADGQIAALSVADAIGNQVLHFVQTNLKELQDGLDTGKPARGFPIPGVRISATVDLQSEPRTARNVIARLQVGAQPTPDALLICAHLDHLGKGPVSASLAGSDEMEMVHPGADDNASGCAALFELAQWFAHRQQSGELHLKRDVIFAAWSGEEMGLLGSHHYLRQLSSKAGNSDDLSTSIVACINMDMIGRLRKNLVLFGTGSSPSWPALIHQANVDLLVPIVLQSDAYLPSDSTSFQLKRVPSITAFTGSHPEYHTPRDTASLINVDGVVRVTQLLGVLAGNLATASENPAFQDSGTSNTAVASSRGRPYLGTVPDYEQSVVNGVRLGGVPVGTPAAQAGLRAGDVVVELAGKPIQNIYDYTYAIEQLAVGVSVRVVVRRGEETVAVEITPGVRVD